MHHGTSSLPVSPLAAVFHSRSCSRCATLEFRSPLPPRFFLHGPILPPPASPFEPTATAAPCFMVPALPTRRATISVTPIPAIRLLLLFTPTSLACHRFSSTLAPTKFCAMTPPASPNAPAPPGFPSN